MDYVFDFACQEYDELQDKAKKGKLTMAEMQYADLLMHYKKSALTAEAMEKQGGQSSRSYDDYSERRSMDDRGDRYSGAYNMRSYDERGGSYRSMMDGRSERMRYSGTNGAAEHLRKAIDHTNDDETRHELMKVLEKLETNNR
jgi:hypothetical protein